MAKKIGEAFISILPDVDAGRLRTSVSGMLKSVTAVAATAVGVGGLIDLGKQGIQTAASLEQAQVAFTTLLHNGQQAQSFLANLKQFAAATPFELPGLIDDSRLLLGVGVAAKDVIPTLTAWGDAAGALGISQDRFNNALLAVTQSLGAGRINAGDMNQIVNAGIPIWRLMSEATGKSEAELRKMSSTGKLLSADVLPKVQAQMEKDYGGSMAKQSQTLGGVWSTLMDTLHLGLANTLQPLVPILEGAIPKAADVMTRGLAAVSSGGQSLISFLGRLWQKDGPAVSGALGYVRDTAVGLGGRVVTLATNVVHLGQSFSGYVQPAVSTVVSAVRGGLVPALEDTISVVSTVVGWLSSTNKWAGLVRAVIVGLVAGLVAYNAIVGVVTLATKAWAAIQALLDAAMDANPIGLVVIAVAALVAGVIYAYTHFKTFRDIVNDVWGFLKGVGAWFAGPFVDFWVGAWHTIQDAFTAARNFVINVLHTIINVALGVFDDLLQAAVTAFGWIPGIGDKLKGAKKAFDDFRQGVNDALDAITKNVSVTVATRVTGPGGVAITNGIGFSTVTGQKAFASGGTAPFGEWVRFNENGPEWLNPRTRQILPAGQAPPTTASDGAALYVENFYATPQQTPRQIAEELTWMGKARGRG